MLDVLSASMAPWTDVPSPVVIEEDVTSVADDVLDASSLSLVIALLAVDSADAEELVTVLCAAGLREGVCSSSSSSSSFCLRELSAAEVVWAADRAALVADDAGGRVVKN